MRISEANSRYKSRKNPPSIEGHFSIPWNIWLGLFDKSRTINNFCMRMLFETILEHLHIAYIMLTISIKCYNILDSKFFSMFSNPCKSSLHRGSSSSINRMTNKVNFTQEFFIKNLGSTIDWPIIHYKYLAITFVKNTLDNWLDSTSFIVGADEEKKFIFLHEYHGEQALSRVESILLVVIRFSREEEVRNKRGKPHLHRPAHPLTSRLRQILLSYQVFMGRNQKQEVTLNPREIRQNEAHYIVLVLLSRVQQ